MNKFEIIYETQHKDLVAVSLCSCAFDMINESLRNCLFSKSEIITYNRFARGCRSYCSGNE